MGIVEIKRKLWIGREVVVIAWWTRPKWQRIRCRVAEAPYAGLKSGEVWVIVEPLEGFTHKRSVRALDVIDPDDCSGVKRSNGHAAAAESEGTDG